MDKFLGKGEIIQAAQLGTLAVKSAKESKSTECGQILPSDVQKNVSSNVTVGESLDLHFSLHRPSILPEKGKKIIQRNLTRQRHDRVRGCIFNLENFPSCSVGTISLHHSTTLIL